MTQFFPYEYNGFLFQQNGRVSSEFDDFDWDISGISTRNTARDNNRPKYSGTILGGAVKVVRVTLNQAPVDRDALVIAMDAASGIQHRLYSLDELGNKWFVNAKCTGLNTESNDGATAHFGYIFEVDDPTYTAVVEEEDIWNILVDEEIRIIIIGGNQPTNPTFEITPGTPVGYYPYTQYVKNYNPIALAQTDGIDLTNGGWDTATLVTAGKMLANGDDVRVFVDGAEVPRWFGGGGMDSATTKVFIRLAWKPGQQIRLRTALDGLTTPARIEWIVNTTNKAVLKLFPINGIIRVGTEEISYQNLNSTTCQANIVEREIRGTSIAAHAVNDVCYWVEHDIRIVHGDAAAIAPVYDERYKPVFDLTSSTLTSRVYTEFADEANLRVGSFIRQVLNDGAGNLCRVYTGNQASDIAVDPATDMGMEIASYDVQGKAKPDTGELAWMLYHPAGLVSVTVPAGEKFKSFSNTTWPVTLKATLESSPNGVTWAVEWNEVIPATPNVWTAITHTSTEAVPATTKYIRFHFFGSINGVLQNFIRFEIDSCTIVLNSSNVIQVGLNGEEANYQFAIEIRNNTTGESLFVDYPAAENQPLVIDSDAMTVLYKGMNAIRSIGWDTTRTNWLRLVPGPNELQYFCTTTGAIQIKTRTHAKAL